MQREFALGLQEQVGQIVGRVAAVRGLTADGDGFPVSVTFVEGAAGGGDVHVDEFGHADPHAFQVFQGLFIGQDAGFHVLLEIVELRGEGIVREGENLRGEYRGVLRSFCSRRENIWVKYWD